MADFSLDLTAYAGSSIENCAGSACQIATKLGVAVCFDFNGVKCVALPKGDPHILVENQQFEQSRKLRGPFDRRSANTHRRHDSRKGEA